MPIDYKSAVDRRIAHIAENEQQLWLSNRELTNAGVRYLSRQLSGLRGREPAQLLSALHLNEAHIDDEAIPALVHIVKRTPNLKILNLANNKLTGAGLAQLTAALSSHPRLELLNVGTNPLGEAGAEALAGYIASPGCTLNGLQAHHCQLGDKGLAALAKSVGSKSQNGVTSLNLMNNGGSTLAANAWSKTLQSDRNIHICHLSQENEAFNEVVKDAYAASHNPNLCYVSPVNADVAERTGRNRDASIKAANLLSQKPEKLSYDDLAFTLQRFNSAQHVRLNNLPPSRYHISQHQRHFEKMPGLPAAGAGFADALFKPDASGFAPLDNPKNWRPADALLKAMSASHTKLDSAFLTKTTPHGVSFLQSAAGMLPSETLVSTLLKQYIKLGADQLLDEAQKPTPLYQAFIRRGDVDGLFQQENWLGKKPNELTAVYNALPDNLKKDVPIHTLRQTMRPKQTGIGR